MKIAIKANPSRGKEIISLLESLGGVNDRNWKGDADVDAYYIDKDNKIQYNHTPTDYKIYTLEEFEKEYPFKVGDLCIYYSDVLDEHITVKILGMTIKDGCIMYEIAHKDLTNEHSYIYKERHTLKPYKEMKEERTVTLTLEKAKEWYKKGGDLKQVALHAFSEKELTKVELPKTWKEFCANYPVQVGEVIIDDQTSAIRAYYGITARGLVSDKNVCPSRKSAEAHLALIQLEQLRDCWRQGWKPDFTKTYKKFRIKKLGTEYVVDWSTGLSDFLVFETKELAKEFLKCFRDLIETAGDLI